MPKRITPQGYHDLAQEKGFEWLGPYSGRTTSKTWWRCPKGHEWKTRYNHVRQDSGCPHCYHCSSRILPEGYHSLASERGFEWLGPYPDRTDNKTWWRCYKGHKWEAKYSHIKQKTNCPHCNKVPSEDYHNLAQARGFEWLGPYSGSVHKKTNWLCFNGHEWSAKYNAIHNGNGCPYCREFKGPKRIAEILKTINVRCEPEMRFDTCRYKYPLPFDLYLPEYNTLIEYQGEGHFEPVWGEKVLERTQRNDAIKAGWAQQNGKRLLIINYWEFDRIAEILQEAKI